MENGWLEDEGFLFFRMAELFKGELLVSGKFFEQFFSSQRLLK